jgi:hypothetical protein
VQFLVNLRFLFDATHIIARNLVARRLPGEIWTTGTERQFRGIIRAMLA